MPRRTSPCSSSSVPPAAPPGATAWCARTAGAKRRWSRPWGIDVSGKRLGILGMGRIGQAVARRAKAFGMELHYHSRRAVARRGRATARAIMPRFEDMLPHCDFLSINCASTPETRGIVNARTHCAAAGRCHRREHGARRHRGRRCADRGPRLRQARRRRPRCVQGRTQDRSPLQRASKRVPAAAYRQRDTRHPQRHGAQMHRQPASSSSGANARRTC